MNKHGKLIVIESGSDASGKATQTQLLYERLIQEGYNVKKIEFPDYNSESSTFVKMYLRGDFGDKAFDVNPYLASTFYSIDRFASFKTQWEEFYQQSENIVLCDRYTYSNLINQASKLKEEEKEAYCNWLLNYEFEICKIPKPDSVIFLNMPIEKSIEFIKERKNKINNSDIKDIHEKDIEYLKKTYENALEMAQKYKWNIVNCQSKNTIRSIEDIHEEIFKTVKAIL